METAQVVALLTFVVVAILVAIVVRRAGAILFRTRVAENFRGEIADLDRRVASTVTEIVALVDVVRRHAGEPESLRPALATAAVAVEGFVGEARALTGPAAVRHYRAALIEELERMARALELVEHGCDLATASRRYARGLEVDTAIKRGYLNLVHALETFRANAASAIAVAEEASPARRLRRG